MSKTFSRRKTLSAWSYTVRSTVLSDTLTPFLYQTRTIQGPGSNIGWQAPVARPEPSSWKRLNIDHVPFEGIESVEDVDSQPRTRPSTITDTEQHQFARLFDMLSSSHAEQLAMKPGANSRVDGEAFVARFPEPLRDKATAAILGEQQAREELAKRLKQDPLYLKRKSRLQAVEEKLCAAKTDVALWDVLEKEAFAIIGKLNLDGSDDKPSSPTSSALEQSKSDPAKGKKKETKRRKSTSAQADAPPFSKREMSTLSLIGPNYPSFLLIALRQLRKSFPTSTLPLSILPTVRALGRTSYVLGASRPLYNELIAYRWLIHSDIGAVGELLEEMESNGIGFDAGTLDIIEDIESQSSSIKSKGPAILQQIWAMDAMRQGLGKLEEWKGLVKQRLEEEALRLANEKEAAMQLTEQDEDDPVQPRLATAA